MRMWNRKVFIRVIEVLLCVACVVALRVTDDESRRVFHYLRNRSREWSLLNNVTWGTIGAALATATCGGYVIITAGLLVAAATGELKGRKTEFFLLGLGVILFGIVGALSLASIDSVPEDLIDNAAVLGALCLLTALVFVADLLMRVPGTKKKHDGTQTLGDKDFTKLSSTTLKTEKEIKPPRENDKASKSMEMQEVRNESSVNKGFDKSDAPMEVIARKEVHDENAVPNNDQEDEFQKGQRPRSTDIFEEERNRKFEDVERQLKAYSQIFDNGRTSRDSQRYREMENRNAARRDYYDNERYYIGKDVDHSYYRNQDVHRRPPDETDTPSFPTNLDKRTEPIFAKIVYPGVKIMRVEREFEDNFEDYRCSDSSQYDNVPTRMSKTSPGILKRNRDVSFNIPPPPKIYKAADRVKDEMEKLEDCFVALQSSIGTQTGSQRDVNSPSSPTDPGYVRHTANNWPQELKSKTPGSSPDHDKH